jgi:predicted phage terminase large subunit-like protein
MGAMDIPAPTPRKQTCTQCKKTKLARRSFSQTSTVCYTCMADNKAKEITAAARAQIETKAQKAAKKVIKKRVERVKRVVKNKVLRRVTAIAKEKTKDIEKDLEKEVKVYDGVLASERKRNASARRIKAKEIYVEKRKLLRVAESESEVEKELLRRELLRRKLIYFTQRFTPKYDAGWLHHKICDELEVFLEDVVAGKSPRTMFFTPPRHGKSQIVSRMFPPWALGRYPWLEFISASYGISLPMSFSRDVRSVLREKYYQELFTHTRLDPEAQNAEGWRTTKGGGFMPAGVGGPITGKGAHILDIDDPVKDAEEADSETMRAKTWDWYGSTAYSRLAPNSGVLLTMTRWHDGDLAGQCLQQMKDKLKERDELVDAWRSQALGESVIEAMVANLEAEIDQWKVISFPAIAEEDEERRKKDEALHETRYPLPRLLKIKATLQPRHWSALYQQNPVPDDGLYFRKENIRYQSPPIFHRLPIRIAWDLAIGEKQTNDYTVGTVGCLGYGGEIHVLEVVRGRWDADAICEAILSLWAKYNHQYADIMVGIEKGQLEMAIKPSLRKLMDLRKIYPVFAEGELSLRPVTDKLVRARPLQGLMQRGMVVFPPGQPWVEVAVHELLRFPGGVFDDIVDSLAWLARMFANVAAPKVDMQDFTFKSWKDMLHEFVGVNADGVNGMAA